MDFNFPTQKQHRIENIFHHDPQCRWDHTQTQNTVQMFICIHMYACVYIYRHMHVYHTHVHLHTFYHACIRAHTLYMFITVHAYIHICIMYIQYISSIHIHRFSYIYLNIHTYLFTRQLPEWNPPTTSNNLCLVFFSFWLHKNETTNKHTHRAWAPRRSPEATALKATNLEAMDWNLTRKSSSDPFVRLGFFPKDLFWKKTVGGSNPRKGLKVLGFLKLPRSGSLGLDVYRFFPFGGGIFGYKMLVFGGCREFFLGGTCWRW